MKKISTLVGIIIIVVTVVVLFGGVFAWQYFTAKTQPIAITQQTQNQTNQTAGWKTYTDTQSGVSFMYPPIFSLKQDGANIILGHSINYTHPNPCDFKGDALPLDKLSDFGVTIAVSNKNLSDTEKDNFVWNYDKFNVGSLNGLKGESGIEGCGQYTYLFPISENSTLVIKRAYITEFKPIISDYQKYLALPGIINPAQEEEYFTKIISTFKFTTPVDQAAGQSVLPIKIGQCSKTTVLKIGTRLTSGINGPDIAGSGSAINYSNGGYQVSYDTIPGIESSRAGDEINLCLISIPENCPAGDERGKIYKATNLRTGGSWELPDSEHSCGGA